ncbi:hypothetical protein ACHAPJ_009747 [Fusarium lateritium]
MVSLLAFLVGIVSSKAVIAAPQASDISVTAGCPNACAQLEKRFGLFLTYPSNSNLSFWDEKQSDVTPACVVSPANSAEVAEVLVIVKNNWCRFAVRSGGHGVFPDDSNSIGGVTVDLSRIITVHDLGNSRVRVGTGLHLRDAYTKLEKLNLSAVLGHNAGVGVGGYSLGGGLSLLLHKHGLTIDTIYEYELVLPNATIVNVTYETYPDLYYALRGAGGGANFGIVTYFTLLSVPNTPVLGGSKSYSINQTEAILAETNALLTSDLSNDKNAAYYWGYAYDPSNDTYSISVTQNYLGSNMNPSVFDQLNSVPFISDNRFIGSYLQLAEHDQAESPGGHRNLMAPITYRPSASIDRELISILHDEAPLLRNVSGFFPSAFYQPLYKEAFPLMRERGGNSIGLGNFNGPATAFMVSVSWDDPSDDDRITAFIERAIARAKEFVVAQDALVPWLYINYALKSQDVFASYGKKNHKRLKSIQKAVDPQGIFTSAGLCRGFFKIW